MLSFFTAMRTHTGEKPAQLQVLAEVTHLTKMIVMTNISTVPIVNNVLYDFISTQINIGHNNIRHKSDISHAFEYALSFISTMWIHTSVFPRGNSGSDICPF